jgi:hypothetical protein
LNQYQSQTLTQAEHFSSPSRRLRIAVHCLLRGLMLLSWWLSACMSVSPHALNLDRTITTFAFSLQSLARRRPYVRLATALSDGDERGVTCDQRCTCRIEVCLICHSCIEDTTNQFHRPLTAAKPQHLHLSTSQTYLVFPTTQSSLAYAYYYIGQCIALQPRISQLLFRAKHCSAARASSVVIHEIQSALFHAKDCSAVTSALTNDPARQTT